MGQQTDRPYLALARRLKALMAREGVNQPDLAAAVDISISYPSKILAGEKRPSYPILLRMAEALHADIDELTHLAGYSAAPHAQRPHLPGWESLREEDRAHVRRTVELLAGLNEERLREGERRITALSAAAAARGPEYARRLEELLRQRAVSQLPAEQPEMPGRPRRRGGASGGGE